MAPEDADEGRAIYVLSPDIPTPTGGIKVLYRHVDILVSKGYRASIVHQQPGFRCTWFENTTPVTYMPFVRFAPGDFLVVPEIYGPELAAALPGVTKVIYNQSGSLTFQGYPMDGSGDMTPYLDPSVVAAFVISDTVAAYVGYVFPGMPLYRMHWSIDFGTFSYVGASHKDRQICFMPRRHAEEATQVFNILKFRGALEGFRVVAIEGMTARQTADVMGKSMLFFSFGYPEGLPLPPAEAMARGCVVVGYDGWGGREYFKREFCYPIEAGDVLAFAETAERVLAACRAGERSALERGRTASKYIREHYSRQIEEEDVVRAWTELMGEEH